MTDPARLAPEPAPLPGLEVRRAEEPAPEVARALHDGVGASVWWVGRLDWNWARWHAHLARPELEIWLPWLHGTPVGYAELAAGGNTVELVSFGLLPAFTGRGIGPRLLDVVLRRAWEMTEPPPARVWLHTCSLDSAATPRRPERWTCPRRRWSPGPEPRARPDRGGWGSRIRTCVGRANGFTAAP